MSESNSIKLSFPKIFSILKPYVRSRFMEQLQGVWFIIFYLIGFQVLVLGLPVVYSLSIALGVFVVIIGLMFFMEGLSLGLMPLGEIAGINLPKKAKLWVVLIFSFLLGLLATKAEPAIGVLKDAGVGVDANKAPLLYSILNDFSSILVLCVGTGVGIAVLLGMLRFFYGWSLKWFIIPLILVLSTLTYFAHLNPVMRPLIDLAWDCGAVTTGPVTVPLVLAMGIGICRIVGSADDSSSGFGVVTLASLFPILAVLLLGFALYFSKNYVGAENYTGASKLDTIVIEKMNPESREIVSGGFTQEEYQKIIETGRLPENYTIEIDPSKTELVDGKIIVREPSFVLNKSDSTVSMQSADHWDKKFKVFESILDNVFLALQAILYLGGFLVFVILVVLREKIPNSDQISLGLCFAIIGMALFGVGIALGLTPLGQQLGSNVSSAYVRVQPWNLDGFQGPIFGHPILGKMVPVAFAFFLGYGATLAEPALNALGGSVEKITIGAFKKKLLMQTVAIGVGLGIALGLVIIVFNIPLVYLLLPPYLLLIFLTLFSSEDFVNFGWDSAGVTTGPITVPLVLALGLGVGSNNPSVLSGFGILSMASVMPIICVLLVGLVVSRSNKMKGDEG